VYHIHKEIVIKIGDTMKDNYLLYSAWEFEAGNGTVTYGLPTKDVLHNTYLGISAIHQWELNFIDRHLDRVGYGSQQLKTNKYGELPTYHAKRMAAALDLIKDNVVFFDGKIDIDIDRLITIALLHDLLEDGRWRAETYIDILKQENKEWAIDPLLELTRLESDTYFDYIEKINNPYALIVKSLDINDHLVFGDNIPESLINRYKKAEDIINRKIKNKEKVNG
jgi:hypothetical protein